MSRTDDRIVCANCGRRIVPRLWHYGGGSFTYMKTQHLCPFCGVVLYETGGGVRRRVWLLLLLGALVWLTTLALAIFDAAPFQPIKR